MYRLLVLLCAGLVLAETTNKGAAPWVKLNDGREMPRLGLGTWLGFSKTGGREEPKGDEVQKAVEWAIDAGYRHIDTASIYDTEGQVGRGLAKKIAEGVVRREDVFVTTKLWNDKHDPEAVVPALKSSLERLGLDYVDLYLIHWPVGQFMNGTYDNTDYVETWKGMARAAALGLARSVGVSNFNRRQMERLLATTDRKPAVLQVEMNLNLQQPDLLALCKSHGIIVTAYTPFGSLFPSKATPDAPQPRVTSPELVEIANRHNKTVPQIALKYLIDLGAIPIPKSITKERIEQNIDLFGFELTPEDEKTLKGYDRDYHTILVQHWKESPYYPFKKD